ncbi:MAG: RdgB/HAM1 family non-canonical purine NTP pyrophosphatase [Candidatus Omnitrophica bacterium]|nr:RdgB/HAM1 family non-canonical purine NTP pyrophosphatase [Candidatus Omnitrophota bacterium]
MVTLLLASRNRHKARELRRLLKGLPVRFLTLDQFPDIPPVEEDGATFRANAVKKGLQVSRRTILPVLAEDSGLEVRALGGRPGVRSARFVGERASDQANVAKLLKVMAPVPESRRQARFVCVMALSVGGKLIRTFEGECPGSIASAAAGRTGFGYDPVFIPRGRLETMAQLGAAVKDAVSHRAKAAAQLKNWLRGR